MEVTMQNSRLKALIEKYLADFKAKRNLPFVVKDSIPVVWFGDLEKYSASQRKIVTVALNPSCEEFSDKRFNVDADSVQALYSTLNEYFRVKPYDRWFKRFENVLNCIDATYYDKQDLSYTAIHIDIYSAIATKPKWGGLSYEQKQTILRTDLFQELLLFLNPDLIVFSANIHVFRATFPNAKLTSETRIGKRGYVRQYANGKSTIITGYNCHGTPFGGMQTNEIRQALLSFPKKLE